MYVVCVYDVESKRCTKFMKILRKYMFHIQNSVFEGELTPAAYKALQTELEKVLTKEDSVIFYFSYNNKMINKKTLGKQEESQIII